MGRRPSKNTSRQRATLAEVADAAGVGKATASRALASIPHPDVSAETRQRVEKVARRLGYRPSSVAKALRTGRHQAVSIVLPGSGYWGWWEPVILGIGEVALEEGCQLIIDPVLPGNGMNEIIARLPDMPTDAVIFLAPQLNVRQQQKVRSLDLPVVFIDATTTYDWAPVVCADNEDGGYRATRYLIERGCRSIAALGPAGKDHFIGQRLAGYRRALAEAGFADNGALVCLSDESYADPPERSPGIEALIERGVVFDGLFATMDSLAAAALRSLHRAGRRIPDDVAVIGFDDERAARLVDPPLTTMRQPMQLIGREAARLAMAAHGAVLAPAVYSFPAELIRRSSG